MRAHRTILRFSDGWATLRGYITRTPPTVYAAALLAPVLAMAGAMWAGLTPTEMLRDPIASAGGEHGPNYLGLFSNLGVVLWTAAASVCLFVGSQLKDGRDRHARPYLLFTGFFTLALMLDDLFMVHENYAEHAILAMYAIAMLFYIMRFFRLILQLDVLLLAFALFFFGTSVMLDLAPWRISADEGFAPLQAATGTDEARSFLREFRYLLEDGFKFIGICCWATFHVRAAVKLLRQPRGLSTDVIS